MKKLVYSAMAVPAIVSIVHADEARLEKHIKQYALDYYAAMKRGEERDYFSVVNDVRALFHNAGVSVQNREKMQAYFADKGMLFHIELSQTPDVVDIRLGTIVSRMPKKVMIQGEEITLDTTVVKDFVVGGYRRHTRANRTGPASVRIPPTNKVYMFVDNIMPHVHAAWDIMQGKWDYCVTDAHPLYQAYVPLMKRESVGFPKERDAFIVEVLQGRLASSLTHEAAHVYVDKHQSLFPTSRVAEEAWVEVLTIASGVRSQRNIITGVFEEPHTYHHKWAAEAVRIVMPFVDVPKHDNPRKQVQELVSITKEEFARICQKAIDHNIHKGKE
jgi:hypothetical protein